MKMLLVGLLDVVYCLFHLISGAYFWLFLTLWKFLYGKFLSYLVSVEDKINSILFQGGELGSRNMKRQLLILEI